MSTYHRGIFWNLGFSKNRPQCTESDIPDLASHLWTMPSGSVGDLIGRRGVYFLSEQLPETFPKLGLSASHTLKTHHKKREETNKQTNKWWQNCNKYLRLKRAIWFWVVHFWWNIQKLMECDGDGCKQNVVQAADLDQTFPLVSEIGKLCKLRQPLHPCGAPAPK